MGHTLEPTKNVTNRVLFRRSNYMLLHAVEIYFWVLCQNQVSRVGESIPVLNTSFSHNIPEIIFLKKTTDMISLKWAISIINVQ